MDTKTILEENREYKQKINALTKQLKGEQQYADEQDEALGIFQQSFPLRKSSVDLILSSPAVILRKNSNSQKMFEI